MIKSSILVSTLAFTLSFVHAHEDTAFLPRYAPDTSKEHLFKRQNGNYPPILVNGPTPLPAWVDAYNAARTAGLIPDAPPATAQGVYPAGVDLGATGLCSWTATQCTANDTTHGPDGTIGIAFDDGPGPANTGLYDFLDRTNQVATHFMIGSTILGNMDGFNRAVEMGGQIAVHTWSHPPMTTQSDMAVLGEIGWTMQLIYDNSGIIPQLFRPPYGDTDNRVRAITEHVFGLHTVIWNHDTFDWCLNAQGGTSCGPQMGGPSNEQDLINALNGWISGPKSPGLMLLEHELSAASANAFMAVYPNMQQQGWRALSVSDALRMPWYQNQPRPADPQQSMTIGQLSPYTMTGDVIPSSSSSSAPASSRAASSTASSAQASSSSNANAFGQNDGDSSSSKSSTSSSLPIIIGGAAGGVALALLLCVCLCCARSRGWCCFGRRKQDVYDYAAHNRTHSDAWASKPQRSDLEKPLYSASDATLSMRAEGMGSTYTLDNVGGGRPSTSRMSSYTGAQHPYSDMTPPTTPRLPPGASAPYISSPHRASPGRSVSEQARLLASPQ